MLTLLWSTVNSPDEPPKAQDPARTAFLASFPRGLEPEPGVHFSDKITREVVKALCRERPQPRFRVRARLKLAAMNMKLQCKVASLRFRRARQRMARLNYIVGETMTTELDLLPPEAAAYEAGKKVHYIATSRPVTVRCPSRGV